MLTKRCKSSYICEVTVEDSESHQEIITLFPNLINRLFECVLDVNEVEERLLSLEKHNFSFNKKKIATLVESHDH